MLRFYRTPRYKGLLGGASPFVYKLETWLRMADISYEETELSLQTSLKEAPRNLIPYVELDGERIGDSSIIIDRLKELHNDPLNDNRLTRAQHVQGGLIKSLCEHKLLTVTLYGRWADGDDETLANFFFNEVPEDQRDAAVGTFRKLVKKNLPKRSTGFVRQELRKYLDMLSFSLGDGPWLFDDAPSTYDAGLFAALASFVHFPLPNPHVKIAREYTNLVEYCDRIRKIYYDYDPGNG